MADAEQELRDLFDAANARVAAGDLDAAAWRTLLEAVQAVAPELDPERSASALESAAQLGADLGYLGDADLGP